MRSGLRASRWKRQSLQSGDDGQTRPPCRRTFRQRRPGARHWARRAHRTRRRGGPPGRGAAPGATSSRRRPAGMEMVGGRREGRAGERRRDTPVPKPTNDGKGRGCERAVEEGRGGKRRDGRRKRSGWGSGRGRRVACHSRQARGAFLGEGTMCATRVADGGSRGRITIPSNACIQHPQKTSSSREPAAQIRSCPLARVPLSLDAARMAFGRKYGRSARGRCRRRPPQ